MARVKALRKLSGRCWDILRRLSEALGLSRAFRSSPEFLGTLPGRCCGVNPQSESGCDSGPCKLVTMGASVRCCCAFRHA
eukprot:9120539-Alexandrium_andersonii.AAC.1